MVWDVTTVIVAVLVAIIFYFIGKLIAERSFDAREKEIRQDAIKRSRAVLGGQFSEQLAPYLPDFPYRPTEVKFLGKPTDFIVFEGLDDKKVERVVFVEVKSGKASLSKSERSLKDAVQSKNVGFEIYRIPEEVTK